MADKATTPTQYLAALPADRKAALKAVIAVIQDNLDPKIEFGIQYGMPAWFVPHSVFPAGYHCKPSEPLPYASVASQKNHMAIYLFCLYCEPAEVERFQAEWKKTGLKLDMGKSCVRFKKLEDVPLELIGKTIKRLSAKKFIGIYEAGVGAVVGKQTANTKTVKPKAAKTTLRKKA